MAFNLSKNLVDILFNAGIDYSENQSEEATTGFVLLKSKMTEYNDYCFCIDFETDEDFINIFNYCVNNSFDIDKYYLKAVKDKMYNKFSLDRLASDAKGMYTILERVKITINNEFRGVKNDTKNG